LIIQDITMRFTVDREDDVKENKISIQEKGDLDDCNLTSPDVAYLGKYGW
jgi:hypothetical protein